MINKFKNDLADEEEEEEEEEEKLALEHVMMKSCKLWTLVLRTNFSLFLNALAPHWISILRSRVYMPTHLSESRRRSSLGPGPLTLQLDKLGCNELKALGRQKETDSGSNMSWLSMLSQSKLLSWFVHMFLLLDTSCYTPTLLPVVLTTTFRQRQACRILSECNFIVCCIQLNWHPEFSYNLKIW